MVEYVLGGDEKEGARSSSEDQSESRVRELTARDPGKCGALSFSSIRIRRYAISDSCSDSPASIED
jgi:hypothetical protein